MNLKLKRQLFNKPKSIITGDHVVVLSGNEKGQAGNISKIFLVNGQYRVIIENVGAHQSYRRYQRNTTVRKLFALQRSIHISNVALLDKTLDKPTRSFIEIVEGQKIRMSCKSKTPILKMTKEDVVKMRKDAAKNRREQYNVPVVTPEADKNMQIGGFYAPADSDIINVENDDNTGGDA